MAPEDLRRVYAHTIGEIAKIRTEGLVRALAIVPREKYIGPGPWSVLTFATPGGQPEYVLTPDADLAHLYQDVVIAIDPARGLNNGQPSFLASCLDSLDLGVGERVIHIGCGVGYYTAIIAEVVGPNGYVLGVEIDPALAARARANLSHFSNVKIVHADGSSLVHAESDAIFVNAGVTELKRSWLQALAPKGRLLVPMTTHFDNPQGVAIGAGKVLKLVKCPNGFSAKFIFGVAIYHCTGARAPGAAEALRASLAREDTEAVRSLRLDAHEIDSRCWLHDDSFCLSTLEPGLC